MIISSRKYACETCIKGHRSSSCKHTDRPLFEIKKKGRPVTQCEHCRELRKTKQVHVKCICESRAESSSSKQGVLIPSILGRPHDWLMDKITLHVFHSSGPKPGFESAAFPNGLPEALEASVAFQNLGEGTSSDSDHGGGHQCGCKSGNPCTCVIPRKRSRKKGVPEDQQRDSRASHELFGHHSNTTRTSSQILARIAELRPVLPRPSNDGFNQGGPVHLPSTGTSHGHASRHPEHVFQPYERAYGMIHQHPVHPQSYIAPGPSNPTFAFNDQPFTGQMMGIPTNNSWTPRQETIGLDSSVFPSLCGCGDDCSCPGCLYHNRSTAMSPSSAYSSCSNPGACGTCLDCTILSLPASAIPPPDTALSIYNSQPDAIDEWLRQMSSSVSSPSSQSFQSFPPTGAQFQQPPPQSWGSRYANQQSNLDQNPRIHAPFGYGRSPPPSMGFATSGERSSDYPPQHQQRAHRPPSSMSNMDGRPVIDPRLLPPNGMTSYFSQSRSRSLSSSSQSSHQSSQDNQGSGPVPIYRPSGRVQGVFPSVRGSPPQLNIRPLVNGGPSSTSSSASPSSGSSSSTRPPYGGNSGEDSQSYNPSLAGLHIY
ncbi:hypothetical protein BYT27DRAFT_7232221 [Phlegmacium glaucopus]|nr:hypothetical protein BYT27DRAFT_7232221 [Phlegmacium glaucopus]